MLCPLEPDSEEKHHGSSMVHPQHQGHNIEPIITTKCQKQTYFIIKRKKDKKKKKGCLNNLNEM